MIRLAVPSIENDDLDAVRNVLATGFLVQGSHVAAFEKAVAERTGVPYAVAVTNCTAALHLSLLALGIKPGNRVVVTAYSWISTANVIELCGARPVFVDIEPETFNMDPGRLSTTLDTACRSSDPDERPKAVLAADIFGQIADFPRILAVADRYGLPVIEDAACSIGASLDGKPAGAWGRAGCFSFHPRKAVTTGEGGMVATQDDRLAWTIKALRNHGLDPDSTTPQFVMPGYNCRMTEFQAALGRTQVAKLDRILATRRKLASHYDRLLEGTGFRIPAAAKGPGTHAFQSYVILLPPPASCRRAEIIRKLRENGIETTIGTWHMPMASYFQNRYGFRRGDFPVTDDLFERALTLPLYEALAPEQQETVVRQLVRTAGPR